MFSLLLLLISSLPGIIALRLISSGAWAFGEPGPDISVSYGGNPSPSVSNGNQQPAINYNRPYFDDISPRNVTSIVDETVVLKCRVKNKGDRTVSPSTSIPFIIIIVAISLRPATVTDTGRDYNVN